MKLADEALSRFAPRCVEHDVRIEVIGRTDRLPARLLTGIERTMAATGAGSRRLRIALDYSSRDALLTAARRTPADADGDTFAKLLATDVLGGSAAAPDVDLLIRTGCEQRLSDFLLWECAFAELYFPDLHWPDFTPAALTDALGWFHSRQRRFGA